ncbi:retrovirus-related pol polyprotein from transposon TNT 1-94 [Tanacetum coccineum]
MTTLAEFMIISCADNRPPMLEKFMTKKYEELSVTKNLQADYDLKATNIVLQGLPPDVYAIINHHKVTKEIWDRVKLLMQGTKLSLQERECKLYDESDKFLFVKGETLYHKFVTDVKLARDLHMTKFPQLDSGLAVLVFIRGGDPIACLNKVMAFLSVVAASRFSSTNNQLRTSNTILHSFLNKHTWFHKFTLLNHTHQCLAVHVFSQGDDPIACLNKILFKKAGLQCNKFRGGKGKVILVLAIRVMLLVLGGTNTSRQARVVKCYNCQYEGHMARQYTQPKLPINTACLQEKACWLKAQEARKILDEEQLAFLADPGILDGQVAQTTILNNAAFQTKDLDAYDSRRYDVSNAKAVLMANLSSYGSDVISEVPHSEPYHNDMDNQSVHAMQDFE